jgi:Tol biopolymer transport system component
MIAFASARSGTWDIWRIPASGGAATQISGGPPDHTEPDWSPDGSLIAVKVCCGFHMPPFVWLIPVAGGAWIELSPGGTAPSWSPNGSRIVYSGRVPGSETFDILVIPAEGGDVLQITTDPADDRLPDWSPDGSQIAFTSERSGNWDIWTIPASGGAATQITNSQDDERAPAWSPDGSRIAFSRGGEIWVMPANGGPPFVRITDTGGGQPAWSPDGNQIAFERDGNIWVIDAPVPVEPSTWGAIKRALR